MEAIFRGEVWGFLEDPVSQGNERLVCESMAEGCEGALESYGSSVGDDLKALDACSAAAEPQRHLAIRVRMVRRRSADTLPGLLRARECACACIALCRLARRMHTMRCCAAAVGNVSALLLQRKQALLRVGSDGLSCAALPRTVQLCRCRSFMCIRGITNCQCNPM